MSKKHIYHYKNAHFGIWNEIKKEFQFGIDEPTPKRAEIKLFKMIRYDSYKWRFDIKSLPKNEWKRQNDNVTYVVDVRKNYPKWKPNDTVIES